MLPPDPAALRRSVASSIAVETGEEAEGIELRLKQSIMVLPGQARVRCPGCEFTMRWLEDRRLQCAGLTSCHFYRRTFVASGALMLFELEPR